EGIIKHEWPLALYLKLTGKGSRFKYGEYKFATPISPLAVAYRLESGEQRLIRLTVVEGWTRWDIASAMSKIPELKLQEPDSALPLMDDVSLIRDIDPKASNLEGYLYPDTYFFSPDASANQVVAIMVRRFRAVWKPEWADKARALHLSPRE